jgi:hypothetical protein
MKLLSIILVVLFIASCKKVELQSNNDVDLKLFKELLGLNFKDERFQQLFQSIELSSVKLKGDYTLFSYKNGFELLTSENKIWRIILYTNDFKEFRACNGLMFNFNCQKINNSSDIEARWGKAYEKSNNGKEEVYVYVFDNIVFKLTYESKMLKSVYINLQTETKKVNDDKSNIKKPYVNTTVD